jgi:hypothetical protein
MPGAVRMENGATTVLVDVPITSERGLIGWILSFDDRAVIEGPPAIRKSFLAFLEESR